MNKTISRLGLILAAVTMTAASIAAPGKQGKMTKKTAAPSCPVCKMSLTSKKDKTHTAAVKIKGKTYYCCSGCAMNKSKPAAKKGKM